MNKEQIIEFIERLDGPEGCAFHEAIAGDPKSVTWRCAGGNDQSLAIKILTEMKIPQKEQETFLKKCHKLGGHCDCEILFNAADRLLQDEK